MNPGLASRLRLWLAGLVLLVLAAPATAHPVPFSYLDLHVERDRIDGTLVVHALDLAHELGVPDPAAVLDHDFLQGNQPRIAALLGPRIHLGGYAPGDLSWGEPSALPDRQAVLLPLRFVGAPPGKLTIATDLFPYDPRHQTFVNVYEGGALRQQLILGQGNGTASYYRGSSAGVLAVLGTFIPAGAHHIWIGPDHLLFLLGLLLMGGSWRRLVGIVSAFTIGHSITLSLAALDIVTLPSRIVEPGIALTIIVVGADNLLRGQGRDLRFWLALCFGLIHGFGFASVLKEFGLPQSALGWSLFSFNVGVELGQLAVVIPVALLIGAIRHHSEQLGTRVAQVGSVIVIAAGGWWFIQRVFLSGGV